MSNLLVQNIKHTNNTTSMTVDSSGQVNVRGESSATTTNLQQGLSKAWVNFNGSGTIATRDSFNVSGLTDDGTGDYIINIANNMSNASYSAPAISSRDSSASQVGMFNSHDEIATGSYHVIELAVSTFFDVQQVMSTVHGDLA